MISESRLPIAVFAAIVAIIAIPFIVAEIHDRRRPVLAEARVVTATNSDPVYRDGRRRVPPGEDVEVALALRLERWGGADQWLSPAGVLEIDGTAIDHVQTNVWPEHDRSLRVFWFSVECSNLGGVLTPDDASERLRYRSFLAPEMGRGLMAQGLPEIHNDDYLGQTGSASPENMGTIRLYARIEVVEEPDDIRPMQMVATNDVEQFLDPGFPTLLLAGDLGPNIEPSAAELFRLPGFEPQGGTPAERNAVTEAGFGKTFTDLVKNRIVVSSWTLAATALAGREDLDPTTLSNLGEISVEEDGVRAGNRLLAWGEDVTSGDLLADGDHWLVLVGDNGDAVLDPADPVLQSWGRPPERTTLLMAAGGGGARLEHLRLNR